MLPFESDQTYRSQKAKLQDLDIPIEALAWFIPGSVPVIGPKVDLGQLRGYLETTIGRAADLGVKVINLVATVNRPNFRLNVDYFHLVRQNEPNGHVSLAASWLIHAHTSDDNRDFPVSAVGTNAVS